MDAKDLSQESTADKPTVLIDLDGRFLGVIGTDGKMMDVNVISTSVEGDAFESDDEDRALGGMAEEREVDVDQLALDMLARNARSTYSSKDFLDLGKAYSPAVASEGYNEEKCIDALFDPRFVSQSRDLRTEGLFSEEEEEAAFDAYALSDEDEEDDGDFDETYPGLASDAKFGLFGGKKTDAQKRGRLVATYIFVHKDRAWVVSETEKKNVWEFPTFELLDRSLTPDNVTYSDLMMAFLRGSETAASPSTKSPDAFKIIPIGKRHVVYLSRLEGFDELQASASQVSPSYRSSTWVPWKKLRVALRLLSFPGELDFKRKTRKTMRKLRSLGFVDEKEGFSLKPKSMSMDSSSGLLFSDEDEGEEDEETGLEIAGFDYYSLSQAAFVRHHPEDDHLFFSGQRGRRAGRGPSRRGRSRGRARGPSRGPGRGRGLGRGRSWSPPRTSRLPGPLRRGLRRGSYGRRGGLRLPNLLLPRPFYGRPSWGRGWYRRRGFNPFVPYLPLALLSIRDVLFPRRYVHVLPTMPYYNQLPQLPAIDPYITPEMAAREIRLLRTTHRYWLDRGYDIVPDFDRYQYIWVRRESALTL